MLRTPKICSIEQDSSKIYREVEAYYSLLKLEMQMLQNGTPLSGKEELIMTVIENGSVKLR